MKVLVTGGTGVVGQAAVTLLLKRGHSVRLLSRNASEDARQWPRGAQNATVDSWQASVSDQPGLKGCAEGCDLVLHLAGVVDESPPEVTFENTNVEGTRTMLKEAERARVGRFIYVSSLGAERGKSPYHRSKRRAEDIVRNFAGGWIILRPGNVYGPGDDVVSVLLTMVRTLPVVPVIDTGDDEFQPIWTEDLAAAIAACVDRTDLHGRVMEIAGNETTTTNDLLDRLGEITGRKPARIPVPGFLAGAGAALAGMLGAKLPISENQLTMLSEGNVIRTPGGNALAGTLGVTPTSLDSGLRKLADAQPEQTPEQGVGALKRKRFWADIAGSKLTPEELFARLRSRFGELTPLHMDLRAEPGTPTVLARANYHHHGPSGPRERAGPRGAAHTGQGDTGHPGRASPVRGASVPDRAARRSAAVRDTGVRPPGQPGRLAGHENRRGRSAGPDVGEPGSGDGNREWRNSDRPGAKR